VFNRQYAHSNSVSKPFNPEERKVNQQIKSDVCTNRFYDHMELNYAVDQNTCTKDLEDSIMTLHTVLTLDYIHIIYGKMNSFNAL
jgi:hypothetical protein